MHGQQGGQRQRPACKFGDRCNKFQQGSCPFKHDGQQQGGNMGGNTGGNFNPRGPRPQYNDQQQQQYENQGPNRNYNQQGQDNNRFNNNTNSFTPQQGVQGQYSKGGFGTQHGNYGKTFNQPQGTGQQGGQGGNYPNQPQVGGNKQPDQFQRIFCRDFHFGQPCKYQGKCSRRHGFDLVQKIHRINYTNTIPKTDQICKIGKFQKDNETYFVLRMGNEVFILTLNLQKDNFNTFNSWKFPQPQLNYKYYNQRQNYIYLAAQNTKTFIFNIYIYDIFANNLIVLEQAHQKSVTGVIHFTKDIVLSTAKDGRINVWKIQGNKGIIDKVATNNLLKMYNPQNNKVQFNFIDIHKVIQSSIIAVGTNDGRILFFIGDQLNFYSINLGQNNAKAFEIKFTIINGVQCAFILAWSLDGTSSSVIALDFVNFDPSTLLTFNAKQNKNNNINFIEIVEDKLFVSNLFGTVTCYSLPQAKKIGVIMCKNRIGSMLSTSYLTQTGIKRNLIIILQNKFAQKPGSLGLYLIKQ